jgi:RecA/RadA recombinase
MANKWLAKLNKMEEMVTERKDVFSKVLRTPSPSVNFIFGRTHGLPQGYSAVFYGPPKGGKSVLSHLMIGHLHKTDPDAIALKIDTEYRVDGQLDEKSMEVYGIDKDRLAVMQTNSPGKIFDQIEKDIAANCQAGMPLKLIIIDSLNGIQGRREQENDSVEKLTIGDHAYTVQTGLKRILGVLRKHDIGLVLIDQVRSEMDRAEQMRGNKFKMQCSFGVQHIVEYFVIVEENKNAAGKKDLEGRSFVNEDAKDLSGKDGKGETTAMKIRVKMKDSTMSGMTKGRVAEFTYDFFKGVVNTHEEVYLLGTRRGVITKAEKGHTLSFEEHKWAGEGKALAALRADPALCDRIMEELKRRDINGDYDNVPEGERTDTEIAEEGDEE